MVFSGNFFDVGPLAGSAYATIASDTLGIAPKLVKGER
jgi:hypothetical protein